MTPPELFQLALGAWVVAELPAAVRAQAYQRQVLAVWAGVGGRGPRVIWAQRWDDDRLVLRPKREMLWFVRAASRIDMTIHGVPIGRPAYRAIYDNAVGPLFLPLRN